MLQIKDVTVKFGGLTAVKNMNFEVKKNEIHSLIGPNGAGKTTTFNAVTRVVETASGDVIYNNESLLKLKTDQIIYKGLARTFQNLQKIFIPVMYIIIKNRFFPSLLNKIVILIKRKHSKK